MIPTRIRDGYLRWPAWDWIPAPVFVGAAVVAFQTSDLKADERLTVATAAAAAVATLSGVLMGMSTVAMAMYQTGSGPRFASLRLRHGETIRKNWLAIIRGFLLATATSVVAIFLAPVGWVPVVICTAIGGGVALGRGGRLLALLTTHLTIYDLDRVDESGGMPIRDDITVR